jgi:hypothetical protein
MLSIVWGIFDIHNVLGVGSTPVFLWLAVMILTLFFIIGDKGWDRTWDLSYARLVR